MAQRAWRLPELRDSTYPTPEDLAQRRAMAAGMPGVERAPGVVVTNSEIGGVECVVCSPPDAHGTIVYLHGGGYRLGSPKGSTPFATRLAAATGAEVVVPTYRLAPEHPFPAGLTDVVAVYDALLDSRAAGIVAAGDSAGGGLAAALAAACIASGVQTPIALVLLSPWLDLTCESPTFASRAETEKLFPLTSAQQAAEMYLQGHDPRDPLASPLFAPLEQFPPTLAYAATDEALVNDTITLASGLGRGRVDATMSLQTGTFHAWPSITPDDPRSITTLEEIGRFVRARF
ncbi:MAG: alpha/beta hydrolase fold domain-containing protein [Acidimicrobiia bacterium]